MSSRRRCSRRASTRASGRSSSTSATQNLADLARRVGDDALASELVSDAFERLASCAESESAPLALRLSCARNLDPALAELLSDLVARDMPSDAATVARARAAALSVGRHVQ